MFTKAFLSNCKVGKPLTGERILDWELFNYELPEELINIFHSIGNGLVLKNYFAIYPIEKIKMYELDKFEMFDGKVRLIKIAQLYSMPIVYMLNSAHAHQIAFIIENKIKYTNVPLEKIFKFIENYYFKNEYY